MAVILKMDGSPVGPSYGYSTLAALQQSADRGDASAAILIAELAPPEQRLARALADEFSGKSESTGMYGKSGKRARSELKAKRAAQPPQLPQPQPPKEWSVKNQFKDDLRDPDPLVRLTAERALRQL